jgi:hypothetical protein
MYSSANEVDAPDAANEHVVSKRDFEVVLKFWKAYKDNQVQRQEIREMTRYSKYVISILHWLESEE